jgi:hypothetical protein
MFLFLTLTSASPAWQASCCHSPSPSFTSFHCHLIAHSLALRFISSRVCHNPSPCPTIRPHSSLTLLFLTLARRPSFPTAGQHYHPFLFPLTRRHQPRLLPHIRPYSIRHRPRVLLPPTLLRSHLARMTPVLWHTLPPTYLPRNSSLVNSNNKTGAALRPHRSVNDCGCVNSVHPVLSSVIGSPTPALRTGALWEVREKHESGQHGEAPQALLYRKEDS